MQTVPVQVGVRLTPRLKAWITARADEEAISVSTWIRTMIAREARKDLVKGEVKDGGLPIVSDG
jgi:hypothetical protein